MAMTGIPPERAEKYERLRAKMIELVKEFVKAEGGIDSYCLHRAFGSAEDWCRHQAINFVDS